MSNSVLEQLNDFQGSQIIGLDTVTNVTLLGGKSNPLQGKITKITKSVVMIFKSGAGYKNMVNRRLAKEIEFPENFQPGPRQWGQRVPNSPFVEHKGKLYLECIFIRPGKSTYYQDGKEIDYSEIESMIPKKKEGAQGGLKNKVVIRTYSVSNILKVRKAKMELEGPAFWKSLGLMD